MSTNPAQAVQGPFLIGLTLNIFLQGIATAQVYLYFTTYKKDRLWIKIFLMLLYLADTLNCALSIFYVYDSLVNHWSDTAYLEYANWVFASLAILTGVIAGMVQLFFAWRVHVLTKSIIVVLAITVCSMANMAGSLGATVSVSINPAFSNLPDLKPQVTVWLVGAFLADVIITTALTWHLRKHRNNFPSMNSVINRIIRITVQTGALTTAVAMIDLACYLAIDSGIHLIFNIPLSKLYTNCLFSSLNSRGGWRYDGTSQQDNNRSVQPPSELVWQSATRPEVFVHVESHELADTKTSRSMFRLSSPKQTWTNSNDDTEPGDV